MSVVAISLGVLLVFALVIIDILLRLMWRKEEELEATRVKAVQQTGTQPLPGPPENFTCDAETAIVPAVSRHSYPGDMISDTAADRILRAVRHAENAHYPFLLPSFDRATPFPDVMREPSRITKVVMRANDWVHSTDQYGFVMPEFCGLWQNVGLAVMQNFDGDWMVPKEKTGYHKITRFKRVRPQDHRIPPILHPRDLPEVSVRPTWVDELSPLK